MNIAVELNVRITNGISDTLVVEVLATGDLGYKTREIDLSVNTLVDANGDVNAAAGDRYR